MTKEEKITFFIIVIWAFLLIGTLIARCAEPGMKLVSSTGAGRLTGPAGTEVTGASWVAMLADGNAFVEFWAVEYNGSGVEATKITHTGSDNKYYLRDGVPMTISFTTAYVDSYKVTLSGATEVLLTWQE